MTAGQVHTTSEGNSFVNTTAAQPPRGSEVGQVVHGLYPSEVFKSRLSGKRSSLSEVRRAKPNPIWRRFERHAVRCDLLFAAAKAGKSSAARIPMIAMTTSNSINVKPRFFMAGQKLRDSWASTPST